MKKLILLIILFPFAAFSQKPSCCSMASTTAFAQFGSDKNFMAAHEAPLPFKLETESGEDITFPYANGKMKANGYIVRSQSPSSKWLFIFHEWWGLNDYIKKEAIMYGESFPNVNVLALDLYNGQLAESPEHAGKLMSSVNDSLSRLMIKGAFAYAGADAKIVTLGWCMGGGWSLQASLMAGSKAIGCVMYYGMPEMNKTKLSKLNTDVLGIFASQDEWISPKIVNEFSTAMESAGKVLKLKNYDAVHAFANPSNPKFDVAATEDAHNLVYDYLKEKFKN